MDEALSLFDDMIDSGVRPNVVCYNSLIHGVRKSGRWEEVDRLLIDMIDCQISSDTFTYSALIDSLCKEGK